MSIDTKTLDFAFEAKPFNEGGFGNGFDFLPMDFPFEAQPFVRLEGEGSGADIVVNEDFVSLLILW